MRSSGAFCASARGWSDLSCGQYVVHAAGAVALGVKGDVEEAQGLESGGDAVEGFDGEGLRQFGAGDLDAGQLAVVADANLMEAEGAEGFFCLLDLGEVFAGDGAAVLDARGEAGGGGLVPEGEIGLAGEGADLGLGELCGDEGSDGVVQGCGLLAGPEGCYRRRAIVEVHAVGEMTEASFCAGFFHLGEELVFAVEAAAGVVALVVGIVELGGVEDVGGDVVVGGEGEGGG